MSRDYEPATSPACFTFTSIISFPTVLNAHQPSYLEVNSSLTLTSGQKIAYPCKMALGESASAGSPVRLVVGIDFGTTFSGSVLSERF